MVGPCQGQFLEQLQQVPDHKGIQSRDGNSGMRTRYPPGIRPDGYGYGDDFLPVSGTRTRPEPRCVWDGYFFPPDGYLILYYRYNSRL
jgi:hypothetical protein